MNKRAETFSFEVIPNGSQFVARLIYEDSSTGLDMAGSTIKEAIYGLLNLMDEYKIFNLQDVQDYVYKVRG